MLARPRALPELLAVGAPGQESRKTNPLAPAVARVFAHPPRGRLLSRLQQLIERLQLCSSASTRYLQEKICP